MDKNEEKTSISCGLNADGLRSGLIELNEKYKTESACARRARLIAFALENARITLRHGDGFAYKADFGRTIEDIRWGDVGLKLDKGVCADEFKKRERNILSCATLSADLISDTRCPISARFSNSAWADL